ncbi:MAG: hypothetical protein AAFX87_16385 [Bacteroidota bacterium]
MSNNIDQPPITLSGYFFRGFKYAAYFMVIAGFMGLIYGAFGGIWLSPAFVAIAYLGIFVMINFVISIPLIALNLPFALFRKGSKRITRYFIYSLSFAIVFLAFFALLKFTGIEVF